MADEPNTELQKYCCHFAFCVTRTAYNLYQLMLYCNSDIATSRLDLWTYVVCSFGSYVSGILVYFLQRNIIPSDVEFLNMCLVLVALIGVLAQANQ